MSTSGPPSLFPGQPEREENHQEQRNEDCQGEEDVKPAYAKLAPFTVETRRVPANSLANLDHESDDEINDTKDEIRDETGQEYLLGTPDAINVAETTTTITLRAGRLFSSLPDPTTR